MYALDRTHLLRRDLDWLPRELKVVRWSVVGATSLGSLGAAGALAIASGGLFAHLATFVGVAGVYAGGRLGRVVMLRRLRRLARGRLDLVGAGRLAEGNLVHVAGRVQAATTLRSFLHDVPVVYRRMIFRVGGRRFVHEAAVDFDIVDANGGRLKIEIERARLLASQTDELVAYPRTLFTRSPLPDSLVEVLHRHAPHLTDLATSPSWAATVRATELVLQPDAVVEIIGYKTDAVDAALGVREGGRTPPMRPALRSGRIPLIITPRDPAEPKPSDASPSRASRPTRRRPLP